MQLGNIKPSPFNPRKNFNGREFEELKASILEKGVIEPIVVRPAGDGSYEIICGERRFRACVDLFNETYDIPHVEREATDSEAMEIQIVENLMRADLTELEEAEGFKQYLEHGTEEELAAKTGCDPRFVRRRIAILSLPQKLLSLWDKGKLSFAALEQLLRVENPQEMYDQAVQRTYGGEVTAESVRNVIERQAPLIKDSLFEKSECNKCPSNTKVQKDLFGDDFAADKVRCLKPECFHDKQKEHLIAEYSEQRGVQIVDRPDHQNLTPLPKKRKECKKCEKFVTEIEIMNGHKRECCSVKACIHDPATKELKGKASRGNPDKAKEKFYKENLEVITIPQDMQFKVAILMMMETDGRFREAGKATLSLEASVYQETEKFIEAIDKCQNLDIVFNAMINKFTSRDGYMGKSALCEWLGTSISAGFVVDEWYLKRKDKESIIELAKEFKILTQLKENIRAQKPEFTGEYDNLQKKVIIESFLKCEIEGKVPKEIRG